jgi:hypothetical protein
MKSVPTATCVASNEQEVKSYDPNHTLGETTKEECHEVMLEATGNILLICIAIQNSHVRRVVLIKKEIYKQTGILMETQKLSFRNKPVWLIPPYNHPFRFPSPFQWTCSSCSFDYDIDDGSINSKTMKWIDYEGTRKYIYVPSIFEKLEFSNKKKLGDLISTFMIRMTVSQLFDLNPDMVRASKINPKLWDIKIVKTDQDNEDIVKENEKAKSHIFSILYL